MVVVVLVSHLRLKELAVRVEMEVGLLISPLTLLMLMAILLPV